MKKGSKEVRKKEVMLIEEDSYLQINTTVTN